MLTYESYFEKNGSVLSYQLSSSDDHELLESHRIFSVVDLSVLMKWMKQLLFNTYWVELLIDADAYFDESLSASGVSVPQLRKFLVKMHLLNGNRFFFLLFTGILICFWC